MPRKVSTVNLATFTCDYCGATTIMKLDPIKYERSLYVTGEDQAPEGWIMASSGRTNNSDDIPDVYFDTLEHFYQWRIDRANELKARIKIIAP